MSAILNELRDQAEVQVSAIKAAADKLSQIKARFRSEAGLPRLRDRCVVNGSTPGYVRYCSVSDDLTVDIQFFREYNGIQGRAHLQIRCETLVITHIYAGNDQWLEIASEDRRTVSVKELNSTER